LLVDVSRGTVEREKKAAEREFEDERSNRVTNQRKKLADSQLSPIFPHLSSLQLERALEINTDNVERTMTWILDNDAALMKMAIDHTSDAVMNSPIIPFHPFHHSFTDCNCVS
jgi:hypothetical protein